MNLKLPIILLLTGPLLLSLNCKRVTEDIYKPETELPPITDTGANVIACRVNGRPFIVGQGYQMTAVSVDHIPVTKYFRILANDLSSRAFSGKVNCAIDWPKIDHAGIYNIQPQFEEGLNFWMSNTESFVARPGKLIITRYDTVARIISGTFDYIGINQYDTSSKVTVTDGRFDFRYPFKKSR